MKYPEYNPKITEPELITFWQRKKIQKTLAKRNKQGKRFYFLQGPPYTSGRIHLGHAWNHAMKDMVLRYKRMNGFHVWDRAGYDMHGLPTEHKVMEKYNLKTKEDIHKFGIQKFSEECYKFSTEMGGLMNQDFTRLGITLDFSDPYMPVKNEFIEAEWFLIKRAFENNRLYKGMRSLHWCPHCETALAKHECEYRTVKDKSIFVKFQVRNKKNEYLIIWTTTPWTLAFNLAIMVNPEAEYIRVAVDGETWIVAEALSSTLEEITEKRFTILEKFTGNKLDKLEYEHPWKADIHQFSEFKKQCPRVHTVILSKEFVTITEGTGLVHCAPGCGPEDYEVGHQNRIQPFNNTDERGILSRDMGRFAELSARTDDAKFTRALEESGHLVAAKHTEHEYPHCQRCHKPVIFRVTPQWFFKVEDLKQQMLSLNEKIYWYPQMGRNAFTSWLENLRDNSISKQRFWGTPVPIWQCGTCPKITVIGSIKELKKKARKVPKNLHKPWIDGVVIKCECGDVQKRIPDILDVWIDAGSASWACLMYPQKEKLLNEWYPADFILEGKDQIRGWFNLLMVASVLAFNKPSFKAVYMHGFVTDIEGTKMSKSLGNIISPYEVIDKYSADCLRYYMSQTAAGEDINFSWEEIALKYRYLNVLWNMHKLLLSLTKENDDVNPFKLNHEVMYALCDTEERYMFSKLHHTIKKVTELFNEYRVDETIKPVESLFLELSRTYIQLVRDKSSVGSKEDKEVVMFTLAHTLIECLKLLAPAAPFITEAIYQNLREEYQLKEQSIHLQQWPTYSNHRVNHELEQDMDHAYVIIQAISGIREKIGTSVRWPLKEMIIATTNDNVIRAAEALRVIIKNQTNVKEVIIVPYFTAIREKIRADFSKLGPRYGSMTPKIIARLAVESPQTTMNHIRNEGSYVFTIDRTEVKITKDDLIIEQDIPHPYKAADFKGGSVYLHTEPDEELEAEGYSRELMRKIQTLRKNAGLQKTDRIGLYIKAGKDIAPRLQKFEKDIQAKCGAEKIKIDSLTPSRKHAVMQQEKIKKEEFLVCFDIVNV